MFGRLKFKILPYLRTPPRVYIFDETNAGVFAGHAQAATVKAIILLQLMPGVFAFGAVSPVC